MMPPIGPPPLIVATVTANTTAELVSRRDEVREADLVELRLDTVGDPDAGAALRGRVAPVIVTCRPRWEGGAFAGDETARLRLLSEAAALGADYIDVEWRASFLDELLRLREGRGVIVSTHDFSGLPSDLPARLAAMRATGADIVKAATTAKRLTDCLPLRSLGGDGRTVLMAMGPSGVPTRILPAAFGSCWTYGGQAAAVGQLPVREMIETFRVRRVTGTTAIFGVAGAPVAHSLSPAMHNAAFAASGVDAVYLPLHADDADDFLGFAEAMGVHGASVTAPLKLAVSRRVRAADALARRLGAVNTVRRVPGGWEGINTDVAGFLSPLERYQPLTSMRAAVLGAGGAARAVAVALGMAGARVTVWARRPEEAAKVAALAGGDAQPGTPPAGSWDLLVNATPAGMAPDVEATPIGSGALAGGRIVYDLVSNPWRTRLLRDAEAAGCRTIGGVEMLVAQAERQWTWWMGREPPTGVMREAALACLASSSGFAVKEQS